MAALSVEAPDGREGPAERLLCDSWARRWARSDRRERVVDGIAGAAFALAAGALAAAGASTTAGPELAVVALLVVLHALAARVEFPVGSGHVAATQLLLVPMLVLLDPAVVPALVALGLVSSACAKWLAGRGRPERMLSALADAWHALGPAAVLVAAGSPELGFSQVPLLALAFAAGCLVDLISTTVRESAVAGIAVRVQAQVIAVVWVVDACLAPIGFLAAVVAQQQPVALLALVPLLGLLLLLARERSRRIDQAHRRLQLVRQERRRLQGAVRRLGDAFASKLDLDALLEIVLRGSIEALDADGGRLHLGSSACEHVPLEDLRPALLEAERARRGAGAGRACEHADAWTLALPFESAERDTAGALLLVRRTRAFQSDEIELVRELVAKAELAAAEIVAHRTLREQATTDALTGLGNRRRLAADLGARLSGPGREEPALLLLFDLDGFKAYNDAFGHPAGDAMLTRLAGRLSDAMAGLGTAYRLGGDEFCALLDVDADAIAAAVTAASAALSDAGQGFAVASSFGAVLLPHEADSAEQAIQLADARMYAHKRGRPAGVQEQTRDVLMRIMEAKQPRLDEHAGEVAQLAAAVGRRLGLDGEALDEVARAAELHDVGKVGIPDTILNKRGPLDAPEWAFMHQHTLIGERILNAAPALRPVARIVRFTHERWDGSGYPDGLEGEAIPLGARIVAVCDAYEAMTSDRPYRRALGHARARRELQAFAGSQFDAEVVGAFLSEIERRHRSAAAPGDARSRASEVAAHVLSLLAA